MAPHHTVTHTHICCVYMLCRPQHIKARRLHSGCVFSPKLCVRSVSATSCLFLPPTDESARRATVQQPVNQPIDCQHSRSDLSDDNNCRWSPLIHKGLTKFGDVQMSRGQALGRWSSFRCCPGEKTICLLVWMALYPGVSRLSVLDGNFGYCNHVNSWSTHPVLRVP